MPSFNIVKKWSSPDSFRAQSVIGSFTLQDVKMEKQFAGAIPIEGEKWQIGIIVGRSGTGKTSIAKQLFPKEYIHGFEYKSNTVLDDFPENMRVDIARALCLKQELVVFDEFTSVVDREIAKVSAFAIAKAVRHTGKRFIAVTCHYDVVDWLEPDWVFCTDDMSFSKKKTATGN
jgi:ABC-type ATPase with predicted acetyltransferase domain